jgi:hypothetical protein
VRRIAALGVLVVVLLVLVVAQLVLPGIAANRLRSHLSRYGEVRTVHVSAFPAIKLLWHRADSVHIALATYRSPSGEVGNLLGQAGNVGSIDVTASEAELGLLRLRDVALRKRGSRFTATARVTESDLRAAVPFLDGVVPVTTGGEGLVLRGTATVLGVTATVDATVEARDGALVIAPNVPFGGLATLTLFADPHVAVQTVGAAAAAGGFAVSATGYLR